MRYFFFLVLAACGTVQSVYLHPEFSAVHANRIARLAIVADVVGEGARPELWLKLAQRYTNDHRDFLVKRAVESAESSCNSGAVDGIMSVHGTQQEDGAQVLLTAVVSIQNCLGQKIWEASASGTYDAVDPELVELARSYQDELGEDVATYVPGAFRILRDVLERLPQPLLSDEYILEKIDLEE